MYLNISMLGILFIIGLFRGSGKVPSVIGVLKCTALDNVLLAILLAAGFVQMIIGAIWVNQEFKIKKQLGYTFVKGDVEMTTGNIIKLAFVGVLGGFISSGFGVGGALIFNPTLV